LRTIGPSSDPLLIARDGKTIATILSPERLGTYSIALSTDAHMLFVGGYDSGVLYDLTTPSTPRTIATIPGSEEFSAASFAAGGDVLITSETTPHGLFNNVRVQVIDGAPLDRLACLTGASSTRAQIRVRLELGRRLGEPGEGSSVSGPAMTERDQLRRTPWTGLPAASQA
jgi:hypothetical protein